MSDLNERRCFTCRHVNMSPGIFECRRYPPTMSFTAQGTLSLVGWPTVFSNSFCGEWAEREAAPAPLPLPAPETDRYEALALDLDAIKARLEAACPGPWTGMTVRRAIEGDCLAIVREHPEGSHKSEKGTTLTIAATLVPQYGDNDTAVMLLHSRADMDALIAEVERLRAQRLLDNEDLARAYDMGRDKERAATVAWLREMTTTGTPLTRVYLDQALESLAERIERGEHRREGDK